jgi:Skp family chaperone for outer membrane proteins
MLGPNLYPGLGAAAAAFGRQAELRAKQRHLDEVNAAIAQAERLTATEALRAQSDAYRQLDQQINSDFAKLSAELAANMDRAIRYGGTLGSGPRSVRTERIDPPNGDRGSKG